MTLTSKTHTLLLATALLVASPAPRVVAAAPDSAAGTVSITVTYMGQGTVDDNHRLWIWLFDSPEIGPGSMPIREAFVATSGASTTIEGLSDGPVWIAVAYDARGGSPGNQPPASGSPLGIHAGSDGRPAAVSTTSGVAVTIRFDDSQRMP